MDMSRDSPASGSIYHAYVGLAVLPAHPVHVQRHLEGHPLQVPVCVGMCVCVGNVPVGNACVWCVCDVWGMFVSVQRHLEGHNYRCLFGSGVGGTEGMLEACFGGYLGYIWGVYLGDIGDIFGGIIVGRMFRDMVATA